MHDLAQCDGIARDLVQGLVQDGDLLHEGHQHAGARLDGGPLVLRQGVEPLMPGAFGGGAIGFRQPVDLGDVEAQRFDCCQRRGRGRSAGGDHLDDVIEGQAVGLVGVDDGLQHDRCAPEMCRALVGDGTVDTGGGDVAQADHRAAHQRDHPRVAPGIAMEHRHNGQVARIERHPPADRLRHR